MATEAMAGYAQSRGVGNSKLMVQISGVALIAGGVSVLLALAGGALAMYVFCYSTDGFGYDTITGALFT